MQHWGIIMSTARWAFFCIHHRHKNDENFHAVEIMLRTSLCYLRIGFPMMLVTTLVSMCYLLICHVALQWHWLMALAQYTTRPHSAVSEPKCDRWQTLPIRDERISSPDFNFAKGLKSGSTRRVINGKKYAIKLFIFAHKETYLRMSLSKIYSSHLYLLDLQVWRKKV